jgi:hypothetical protein
LVLSSVLIALLDQVFHAHLIFKHAILHWNILLNTLTQSCVYAAIKPTA